VNWLLALYNRVGDRVIDTIRRGTVSRIQDIGPISANDSGSGTWDSVIYNGSVHKLSIVKIDIRYMDGSEYLYTEPEIRQLNSLNLFSRK